MPVRSSTVTQSEIISILHQSQPDGLPRHEQLELAHSDEHGVRATFFAPGQSGADGEQPSIIDRDTIGQAIFRHFELCREQIVFTVELRRSSERPGEVEALVETHASLL